MHRSWPDSIAGGKHYYGVPGIYPERKQVHVGACLNHPVKEVNRFSHLFAARDRQGRHWGLYEHASSRYGEHCADEPRGPLA